MKLSKYIFKLANCSAPNWALCLINEKKFPGSIKELYAPQTSKNNNPDNIPDSIYFLMNFLSVFLTNKNIPVARKQMPAIWNLLNKLKKSEIAAKMKNLLFFVFSARIVEKMNENYGSTYIFLVLPFFLKV